MEEQLGQPFKFGTADSTEWVDLEDSDGNTIGRWNGVTGELQGTPGQDAPETPDAPEPTLPRRASC